MPPWLHALLADVLHEVLDEVLDVFEPRSVHIGHDEWYSTGLCDRCQGKDPAALYAGDVARIQRRLTERGVRTMMWADKLLDAIDTFGYPCGGAAVPVREGFDPHGEILEVIPSTHRSIDLMPTDITFLHWYWSLGRQHERTFQARGMCYLFGNFYAFEFPDWSARRASRGTTSEACTPSRSGSPPRRPTTVRSCPTARVTCSTTPTACRRKAWSAT